MSAVEASGAPTDSNLEVYAVSTLVIDLWRIFQRVEKDSSTPERVRTACEIAMDRAHELGFEVHELVGELYHPSMRVQVIHQEGGSRNQRISECIAPAIYYQGQLIQTAQVVVTGEDENAAADG